MEKIALYPGSFDPFTLGHQLIVDKSLTLFDKVVIAIGENNNKRTHFSQSKRINLIRKIYKDNPRVEIAAYNKLTADYCKERAINFIVRGIRNVGDFEFERNIAQINKRLNHKLETVFLMTPPQYSEISSSIVRDILLHGGNPLQFMSKGITMDDLLSEE